jgi:WD40 repeat protein
MAAAGEADGFVRVWNLQTGLMVQRLPHQSGVYSVAFSPDGSRLVSGCSDGLIRVWDTQRGEEIVRWQEKGRVYGLAFHPQGRIIAAAAGAAMQLSLWAPEDVVDFARSHVTRNLTREEWNEYFEGSPYRKTCPLLP